MNKTKTAFDIIQQLSSERDYSYDAETEQLYTPFLTNRGFSNFYDTIMLSVEMNTMAVSKTPRKWQHDFYHHAILPKKKRFASWAKPIKDTNIQTISDAYNCSKAVAEQYSLVLTASDIEELTARMYKGGR